MKCRHIRARGFPGTGLPAVLLALPAPLFAAPASPAPALNTSDVLDTVGGLIVVLALVLALAWVVKRYLSVPGMGKGRVQVVGGVSLGPRERAVIVEVDGERLLLGVAQGNVRMLHQLQASVADEAGDFGQALVRARESRDGVA